MGERAREHCDPGFWSYFLLAGLGRYAARFIIVADVANERNKALWAEEVNDDTVSLLLGMEDSGMRLNFATLSGLDSICGQRIDL